MRACDVLASGGKASAHSSVRADACNPDNDSKCEVFMSARADGTAEGGVVLVGDGRQRLAAVALTMRSEKIMKNRRRLIRAEKKLNRAHELCRCCVFE